MAKILVAEDDAAMCQVLAQALTRAGHDVLVTHDGLEAFAALEKDNDFDLLLTDIVMPGMDGIELSQKAQRLKPTLKIMFITGFAGVAMEAETLAASGDSRVLSKPFHLNDLVEQVKKLLLT